MGHIYCTCGYTARDSSDHDEHVIEFARIDDSQHNEMRGRTG